jgi:predicted amidohydrolase
VKVAAHQAPLLPAGSVAEAIANIRAQVRRCEAEGVQILCCPEAVLGGLADDAEHPADFAIDVRDGRLDAALAPLASDTVTTIVGFTEIGPAGELYNAAAVFHQGAVRGVYRKRHPAIRKSVYRAGEGTPVYTVHGLTFGILICNDSNFPELARLMVSRGARALFIPTNNGLPPEKADVVAETRAVDVALASENDVAVVRADVAGRAGGLMSHGSSAIVARDGTVIQTGRFLTEDLLVADMGYRPAS